MRLRHSVLLAVTNLLLLCPGSLAESVVSVIADFDDGNTVPSLVDIRNVVAGDCKARVGGLPTHSGANALIFDVAAANAEAGFTCELISRAVVPFEKAEGAAVWCWLEKGRVSLWLRLRDANGRVFHSKRAAIDGAPKWRHATFTLDDDSLEAADASNDSPDAPKAVWPIEVVGARVVLHQAGRQRIILDDFEVNHTADGPDLLRGQITLGDPTHCFDPGADVPISVRLENLSRRGALPIAVELELFDAAGESLGTGKSSINLARSSAEFRSYQDVPFNALVESAGVFRFIARATAPGWPRPVELECSILVAPSNRTIPRGRETFFGIASSCVRESPNDRNLEISLLERLGAQHLVLDVSWSQLEPRRGAIDLSAINDLVDASAKAGIAISLRLVEPPTWLADETEATDAASRTLISLAAQFRRRVRGYVLPAASRSLAECVSSAEKVGGALRAGNPDAVAIVEFPVENLPADSALSDLRVPDGVEIAVRTAGESDAVQKALATLETAPRSFRRRVRLFIERPPRAAIGGPEETFESFSTLVRAAKLELVGVAVGDLRDDARDRRRTDLMTGLVRRDFSPRAEAVAFSSAVVFLAGLLPSGALPGAGDAYDSWLFLGGARQVAVLIPRAGAIRPSLLMPRVGAPGALSVVDFSRTPADSVEIAGVPVIRTPAGPILIEFIGERSHGAPVLSLAPPIVRAPAEVRCGASTKFEIVVAAPPTAPPGYVQFQIPSESGIASKFSAARLDGAGRAQQFEIPLERTGALAGSDLVEATLRIAFGSDAATIPIRILPE